MNHGNSHFKSHSGFTIVELLVVIVIIGILAAITIVSYTGISQRAIVSSLQSDLTNAANQLKLDQVTSSSYPATLALANGGKGITQSQSLDSIIYIPDNTSNPNNFCLEYRKGNNTYAIDNSSAVSSGACLQNLVTNGDFSSGTSGWNPNLVGLSTNNNILTVTINTLGASEGIYQGFTSIVGHKYYFKLNATPKYGNNFYIGFDHSRSVMSGAIANTLNVVSVISISTASSDPITFYHDTTSGYAINNTFTMQNIVAVDLTATFGAGNEPTKTQMDTIIATYPNGWFNIVAKANL